MNLDFSIIAENWTLILKGFGVTILICSVSIPLAMVLGSIVAVLRLSRYRMISAVAVCYVEVFRNIPFMIQIFLFYYVLPFYGFRFPPMVVGIIALSMFGSTYYSEIIRGAILSVPRGQLESARATGMSYQQAMRYIIFPQLLGYLIPPATNQATTLVKESAILSTITVAEMTMAAVSIQLTTYSFFEVLIAIALLYWALNGTIGWAAGRLEAWHERSHGASRTRRGKLDVAGQAVSR